ncbi:MAG: GNAT family N-acetyltransferase [Gordonia sp. (in: high G+C Gram-positive bacteria)]|uniref:GNAT family N-acetyltransferase n=1 Tax=Gordonia sp. (in: high G+C Gram-positive bacteria) TaxID=84139 RepID=UPI003BB7931D
MHRKHRRVRPPQAAREILQQISEVVHNPVRERFELWVAGDLVGVLGYRYNDDARATDPHVTILHTVLYDEYSGHGLATRLSATAVDHLHRQGLHITALCSFTRHYLQAHPALRTPAPYRTAS